MQANIFKIKRNELADGSGLRTTIYFKGCPLRCVWCSTPQAHERPTRILWDSKHCLYCNLCVSECPTGSLAFSDNRLTFTPDTCTFCRACTDHCPSRMLHFVGQMMNMDEIMERILADRELYGNGGVILSGGDPLHPQNVADILKLVQRVRAECPGKDIWVWTGYKLDELNEAQMQVVNLINVLVDGKFVQDLKDPALIWRGSSNQVVHHLR